MMRKHFLSSFVLSVAFAGAALAQTPPPTFAACWPSPSVPVFGQASKDTICVYVLNQVRRPGVYYLPRGSTVHQAIEAAQGVGRVILWQSSGIIRPYRNEVPTTIRFGGDRAKEEQMTLEDGDQLYLGHEVY